MLDPAAPLHLLEVPGVTVYADHADPARFYVLAATPRVARDARGQPLLNLLVYGHGRAEAHRPLGGQVTLSLTLALSPAEHEHLTAALDARLAAAGLPAGVTLVSPDWQAGEAHAHLLPGADLTGQPSLMGANECVLSASLNAEGAAQARRAWEQGLPAATVRYEVQIRAARHARMNFSAVQAGAQMTADVNAVHAATLHLTLEGPLSLSPGELRAHLQITDL